MEPKVLVTAKSVGVESVDLIQRTPASMVFAIAFSMGFHSLKETIVNNTLGLFDLYIHEIGGLQEYNSKNWTKIEFDLSSIAKGTWKTGTKFNGRQAIFFLWAESWKQPVNLYRKNRDTF